MAACANGCAFDNIIITNSKSSWERVILEASKLIYQQNIDVYTWIYLLKLLINENRCVFSSRFVCLWQLSCSIESSGSRQASTRRAADRSGITLRAGCWHQRLINIYDTAEHLAWPVRPSDANHLRLARTRTIVYRRRISYVNSSSDQLTTVRMKIQKPYNFL